MALNMEREAGLRRIMGQCFRRTKEVVDLIDQHRSCAYVLLRLVDEYIESARGETDYLRACGRSCRRLHQILNDYSLQRLGWVLAYQGARKDVSDGSSVF
jgi:hypothetical protein